MSAAPPVVGLGRLFLAFVKISVLSVGGGLSAWIWREMVERRGWLDAPRFARGIALAQIVPGASAVNLAIFVGTSLRGAAGAVVAFAGLVLLPMLVLLVLGALYGSVRHDPLLQSVLAGMAAAAIGLNVAVGVRLARSPSLGPGGAVVALAMVLAVGLLRLPLLPVLAVLGPIALAVAWWSREAGAPQ